MTSEPPFPIQHGCRPRRWCGQCRANRDAGFPEAYKGNGTRRRERTGELAGSSKPNICPHLGEQVAGASRVLRVCNEGIAPKIHGRSLIVCCNAVNEGEWQLGGKCGPSCSGYPKEAAPTAAPKYVYRVPPYEPIRPSSKRAVCTVVVGETAERNHQLTGPSHRAYAAAHGADYIVLRGQTQEFPVYEKFRYRDVVDQYPEGTLCLDSSDTHILPGCPSIWDEVPPGTIGMTFDHRHTRNHALVSWGDSQLIEVCRLNGTTPHPAAIGTYHNSGVWFGRPDQANYWTPPPVGFVGHWCDEETWCRHQLHALGLQLHELDWRWNWCWANDRTMSQLQEARPWIVHLAGMDNPSTPAEWKLGGGEVRTQMLRMLELGAGAVR